MSRLLFCGYSVINAMVMFSIYVFICTEEPDDVNNFTKSFAQILKF